jgi:hypothetical protein
MTPARTIKSWLRHIVNRPANLKKQVAGITFRTLRKPYRTPDQTAWFDTRRSKETGRAVKNHADMLLHIDGA